MRIDNPLLTTATGDTLPPRVLLSKTTLNTTASVSLSLPAKYRFFNIIVVNLIPATDDTELAITISTDGGTTFASASYDWAVLNTTTTSTTATGATGAAAFLFNSDAAGAGLGNAANESGCYDITIMNANDDTQMFHILGNGYWIDSSNRTAGGQFSMRTTVLAKYNAVKLAMSSGNMTSGEILLYGVG